MAVQFEVARHFPADPDRVFEALTDLDGASAWMPGLVKIEPADAAQIAARGKALEPRLGAHLADYADLGNGPDAALAPIRLPAPGAVTDGIGLAQGAGADLKPFQGLNEGLARL